MSKYIVIIKWNRPINVVSVARTQKLHSPTIPAFRTLATLIGRFDFTILFKWSRWFRQIFFPSTVGFGRLGPQEKNIPKQCAPKKRTSPNRLADIATFDLSAYNYHQRNKINVMSITETQVARMPKLIQNEKVRREERRCSTNMFSKKLNQKSKS